MDGYTTINSTIQGPWKNLAGGTKTDTGPSSFWILVETCTAGLYSNQNVDKTATML